MKKLHYLSALSLAIGLTTSAVHAKEAFTIEHLPHVQNTGNLVVSPNGEFTAYTLSVPRNMVAGDKDGRPDTQLYLIKGDSEPQLFIGDKSGVSSVVFSADSQTIYFKTKRDGDKNTALYSISVNGGEATKVFEFETSIGDYAVSEDGQTLFFVARAKDTSEDLKDKGFNAYVYEEDSRLASLYSVSLSNEDAEAEKLFDGGHVTSIDLSSDGKTIVAAVAPTNLIDDFYMERNLLVLDSANGEVKNTMDIPGKLGGFEISPNNKFVAFNAGTDKNDPSNGVLMVGDLAKGSFTQLTPNAEQHVMDVDWMGNDILTVAHRGVETALVTYSVSGKEKRTYKVSDTLAIRSADIGDDEIRIIADSASHPREVFAVERRGEERLSQHNSWLDNVELASQSTFVYEARDGRQVESLLITPNTEKPADGYPLIVMVHGGPEAHYSDGWLTGYSLPGQFAAAEGYAVVYPNYRGSTGRGVAFSKEHQNDYAGKEFDDLVDAVQALDKEGLINKDRVGITGGSYGGYASMWGATALTEHFAAAVAFVGISNQVSKFGTSDIPNEMQLVHSLKWPWEGNNWMNLIERSPIFHAGKSKTPILILHGEKDTRVHPSQSMELFRSLKVRTNTPTRLVFYPNEAHGNRNAAAQYDYALRLMRWMNTYLAPGAGVETPKPDFDLNMSERLKKDEEK